MFTKHTMKNRTYRSWAGMKSRCNAPGNPRYKDYGGRGITVCTAWNASFDSFVQDMGERPAGLSLDRIDNAKGYYKENCRWATREEQQRNTRRSVLTKEFVDCIYYAQETANLSDRELARQLGRIFNVKADAIREVLKGRCWKRSTTGDCE